jgi:hypothetical protein
MIFADETEERSLRAFASNADAIVACEGLHVEVANWLFWSNDGTPLKPIFTVPNKRGLFTVANGVYVLEPTDTFHHAHLSEALDNILIFEGPEPFCSASAVKSHIQAASR